MVASAKSITTKGDLAIGVTGAITDAIATLPQGLAAKGIVKPDWLGVFNRDGPSGFVRVTTTPQALCASRLSLSQISAMRHIRPRLCPGLV